MPKIAVINGDTTVLITPDQLRFANRQIAGVEYLQAKTITLDSIIGNYRNNLKLQIDYNFELQNQNKAYSEQLNTYKNLIRIQNSQFTEQNKQCKKKARKKRIRAIFVSGGVGIIIGLIGSIFI